MSTASQQIVGKAWNFAHVLRDDGLSYMGYTEQITFLLFLKMADEQSKPPYSRKSIVPAEFNWQSLKSRDGDELLNHIGTFSKSWASGRACSAKSSSGPSRKSKAPPPSAG
jgi:type I restriction-modification system DNA methylase subunit